MLDAGSGWNKPAPKYAFLQGLGQDVITEVTCWDDQTSLYSLTDLPIFAWIICPRPRETQGNSNAKPMQIGQGRLIMEKLIKHFYCGSSMRTIENINYNLVKWHLVKVQSFPKQPHVD